MFVWWRGFKPRFPRPLRTYSGGAPAAFGAPSPPRPAASPPDPIAVTVSALAQTAPAPCLVKSSGGGAHSSRSRSAQRSLPLGLAECRREPNASLGHRATLMQPACYAMSASPRFRSPPRENFLTPLGERGFGKAAASRPGLRPPLPGAWYLFQCLEEIRRIFPTLGTISSKPWKNRPQIFQCSENWKRKDSDPRNAARARGPGCCQRRID